MCHGVFLGGGRIVGDWEYVVKKDIFVGMSKWDMNIYNKVCCLVRRMLGAMLALVLICGDVCGQEGLTDDIRSEDLKLIGEAVNDLEMGEVRAAYEILEGMAVRYSENYLVGYELGVAELGLGMTDRAAKRFGDLTRHGLANDQTWQMMGNALDAGGRSGEAAGAYREGLRKFPRSGRLMNEMGTLRLRSGDYAGAIGWFEQGMEAEPEYAGNFYRAGWMELNSSEPRDGIRYGEALMLMEMKGERVGEMSELLYRAWGEVMRGALRHEREPRDTVDVIVARECRRWGYAGLGDEVVSFRLIGRIKWELMDVECYDPRSEEEMGDFGLGERCCVAWEKVREMEEAIERHGHWEAYCVWLLREGDRDQANEWMQMNEDKMERFAKWLGKFKGMDM